MKVVTMGSACPSNCKGVSSQGRDGGKMMAGCGSNFVFYHEAFLQRVLRELEMEKKVEERHKYLADRIWNQAIDRAMTVVKKKMKMGVE